MQNDAAFSEAFNFEKEIRDTLIYNKRQALKERFHTLDKGEQALPRFKRVAESDDSLSAEARKVVKALEKGSYF